DVGAAQRRIALRPHAIVCSPAMRLAWPLLVLAACSTPSAPPVARPAPAGAALRFSTSYATGLADGPLDGRLLVVVAPGDTRDAPRLHVNDADGTAQVFGVDVEGWKAGDARAVDGAAVGYPVETLAALPPGDYVVEAVLHRYETFRRADGHVVK